MKYGSVCSGIEAATVAWHPLGWEAAWFAEIDGFCCALLKHHYPDVINYGDFQNIVCDREHYQTTSLRDIRENVHRNVQPIDLLVGGTPCQSFSVAGLRGGLSDDRGNLALEFLKLVDRMRPRWVVWENVPGVLSSLSHDAADPCPPPPPMDLEQDGTEMETEDEYDSEELHAFNCFLAGLSELGYGIAYRVLDAQYFGVPQRRRRVFVVGYLGDWRRAAAVLFDETSLSGNPAPSRETGKDVAGFALTGLAEYREGAVGALRAEGGDQAGGSETLAVAFQEAQTGCREYENAGSLRANGPGHDPVGTRLRTSTGVRRLTPEECEALQGFPRGYTKIPYRGKPASDGPRYRALGNSMAVPCMNWLGRRIQMVEDLCETAKNT